MWTCGEGRARIDRPKPPNRALGTVGRLSAGCLQAYSRVLRVPCSDCGTSNVHEFRWPTAETALAPHQLLHCPFCIRHPQPLSSSKRRPTTIAPPKLPGLAMHPVVHWPPFLSFCHFTSRPSSDFRSTSGSSPASPLRTHHARRSHVSCSLG